MRYLSRILGAWRGEASWIVLLVVLGYVGLKVASPAELGGKLRKLHDERAGTPAEPTLVGRALGYAPHLAHYGGATVDPLSVMLERRSVQLPSSGRVPVYEAHRLAEYVRAPQSFTLPIRGQDFRPLAAQAPYRQPPPPGNVTLTASDVLATS